MALLTSSACYKRDPGIARLALAEAPLTVQVIESEGPVAWIEVMIRSGSAHDPIGRDGTAWLTAQMLRTGGTRDLEPAAFESALQAAGATIEVIMGPEVVRFQAKAPPDHAMDVQALLGALITTPRWDPTALAQVKAKTTEALQSQAQAIDAPAVRDLVRAWVYRGHPYGHAMEGRLGAIDTISLAEVKSFYDDRYVRAATVAGVAGAPEIAGPLSQTLSALPPRLYEDVTPRAIEPVDAVRYLWVDAGAQGQPVASIGFGRAWTLEDGAGAEVLVAADLLEERLQGAIGTQRGLGLAEVAVEPFAPANLGSPEPADAAVHSMVTIGIDGIAPANVTFVLKLVSDVLASAPPPLVDGEARRTKLLDEAKAARGLDGGLVLGFRLEDALVGAPDAATDLESPLDPTVLAATRARLQEPTSWKIVVVSPDVSQIIGAIGEGTPTPVVYGAGFEVSTDVVADDKRLETLALAIGDADSEPRVMIAEDLFR